MSVIQTHAQTDSSPAEYDFTTPGWCVACQREHDLDEDTGRNVIEGGPEGDFVLCDHCDLYCACGDSVTEWGTEPWTKSTLFLKPGTTFCDGKAICLNCDKEAVMAIYNEVMEEK
jgi:hypothetical protein